MLSLPFSQPSSCPLTFPNLISSFTIFGRVEEEDIISLSIAAIQVETFDNESDLESELEYFAQNRDSPWLRCQDIPLPIINEHHNCNSTKIPRRDSVLHTPGTELAHRYFKTLFNNADEQIQLASKGLPSLLPLETARADLVGVPDLPLTVSVGHI
ncbi:unnamed protein product [Protopolystoma xenopodis]|uniref:Uncharacterized protein n=1 Tax=Protopolystoma xenopodis TaxID=117903 RepID=A0A3S5AR70_9PLAT|nr:unnamed protein product [Protopolystoma xenopodis]